MLTCVFTQQVHYYFILKARPNFLLRPARSPLPINYLTERLIEVRRSWSSVRSSWSSRSTRLRCASSCFASSAWRSLSFSCSWYKFWMLWLANWGRWVSTGEFTTCDQKPNSKCARFWFYREVIGILNGGYIYICFIHKEKLDLTISERTIEYPYFLTPQMIHLPDSSDELVG